MGPILEVLTDVADQAVVWPVAAVVAVALLLLGWRRGLLGWCLGVGATLGAVLVLKLGFYACVPSWGSTSGHAASAAAVAGGLWALGKARRGAVLVALLAGAAMGATRLALQVHSPLDVVLGTLVGMAGAALVAAVAGPRPASFRARPMLLAALVVALVMHGRHLGAEAAIRGAARAYACPFR